MAADCLAPAETGGGGGSRAAVRPASALPALSALHAAHQDASSQLSCVPGARNRPRAGGVPRESVAKREAAGLRSGDQLIRATATPCMAQPHERPAGRQLQPLRALPQPRPPTCGSLALTCALPCLPPTSCQRGAGSAHGCHMRSPFTCLSAPACSPQQAPGCCTCMCYLATTVLVDKTHLFVARPPGLTKKMKKQTRMGGAGACFMEKMLIGLLKGRRGHGVCVGGEPGARSGHTRARQSRQVHAHVG